MPSVDRSTCVIFGAHPIRLASRKLSWICHPIIPSIAMLHWILVVIVTILFVADYIVLLCSPKICHIVLLISRISPNEGKYLAAICS